MMLANALVMAIKIGSLEIVQELLEDCATADAVDEDGKEALMLALEEGNVAEW